MMKIQSQISNNLLFYSRIQPIIQVRDIAICSSLIRVCQDLGLLKDVRKLTCNPEF